MRFERARIAAALLTTVAVSAVVLGLRSAGAIAPFEVFLYDFYVRRVAPEPTPSSDVFIVEITEKDIRALGHWPISDTRYTEMLRRLIDADPLVIGVDVYRDLPVPPGDYTQLEQILLNLAVNARDAMPNGGTLRFRTTQRNLDPADPRFAAFQLETDRFVCVEVIDSGAGIAPEIIGNIFDAFFTTKPVGKGTGLGLSLFYTYAREVGGAMEIESEPGKGTTVSIYLPHSDQLVFAMEESIRSLATGTETILIAEDEPIVAEFLVLALSEAGYRVISCADGREVVEKFQKYRDSVDAVLLDYRMPELTGIEAFDLIHEAAPEIPVVLMSGNIAGAEIRDLRANGIRDVLRKPCSVGSVLQSIRRAIDTSR